jgi:AcrR family transcriptional regulator
VKVHNDRYAVKYNSMNSPQVETFMARSEQKRETRQRILDAAARGFRRGGFGGLGVDGLAKEAGVTSGAFYVHFKSKSDAFRESVAQGVADVERGVRQFQTTSPKTWWSEFVRFYLGTKRKCELAESCGLQSLASEVARADAASRKAFTSELMKVAQVIADGPRPSDAPATTEDAYIALSTLIGTVTLTRAVDDASLANRIAAAAEAALLSQSQKPKRARKSKS